MTRPSYLTLACPTCGRQKNVIRFQGAQSFTCCNNWVAIVAGKENENFMLTADYTVTYHKLITTNVHPPIPVREYDWSAHLDGQEEGAVGWGATREAAILGLLCTIEDQMEGTNE